MMVIQTILAGLSLGFAGSFHCVGMCGPLALSLPVYHLQGIKKTVAHFLYNMGRVFTYSVLGFLFGMLGKGFAAAGWQQLFSIVTGSAMLILTLLYFVWKKNYQPKWLQQFNRTVQKNIAYFLQQKNNSGYFLLGTVNGLLPCGMVYMAIAAALVTGDVWQSTLLMGSFGLATLPAMLLLGIVGSGISISVRQKMKQVTPIVMILVSCLLILRGMNLGIPFISPQMATQAKEVIPCH
jgi:uncharacterized protein